MIAAMVTPALLILASSSLIATALVRLARVVDRVRELSEIQAPNPIAVTRHQRRALLAERALSLFFFAVLYFVLAGFAIAVDHWADDTLTWLPVLVTSIGMGLIAAGSAAMLAECWLAATQIRAEIGARSAG